MSSLYARLLLLVACFFFLLDGVAPVLSLALDNIMNSHSQDQDDSTCSFHLNLSPSTATNVTLQQHHSGGNLLTISLSLEGQGWVGVGFNRNGNMIGSTVVIGFPGQPLTQDINPGRYYLGAKELKLINRVDANGTRVGIEWPQGWVEENISNNDDDGESPEWRRSLYLPQAEHHHHRLLAISDASIEQNSTHTTLKFTRPLEPSDSYMTKVHPHDLNTLIWAVGRSNEFGYHGSQRGSHTLNFTECSYGTLMSSQSSLLLNDDTREVEVEEQDVEDLPESGASREETLEMNSQTSISSGALGLEVTLYQLSCIISMAIYPIFV